MLFYGYYRKDLIKYPIKQLINLPPVLIIKASTYYKANKIISQFSKTIDLIRIDNYGQKN